MTEPKNPNGSNSLLISDSSSLLVRTSLYKFSVNTKTYVLVSQTKPKVLIVSLNFKSLRLLYLRGYSCREESLGRLNATCES